MFTTQSDYYGLIYNDLWGRAEMTEETEDKITDIILGIK
jgi:hypothetical protein